MQVNDWNHVHYALAVARAGTLSGAAEQLGVSHSTVLRRVDTLEKSLRTRLFYRHARGYVPTEAGRKLMRAAESMQAQLNTLVGSVGGADEQLCGTLLVSVPAPLLARVAPLLRRFQRRHPGIALELDTDPGFPSPERGEAHIGIRIGAQPEAPDCVVQSVTPLRYSLFASPEYLREKGSFDSLERIGHHRFIGLSGDAEADPMAQWVDRWVPGRQITLRCSSADQFPDAVRAGFGIAPLSLWQASGDDSLCRLLLPPDDWTSELWLFTHRDMRDTRRVRALCSFIGERLQRDL